MYGHWPYQAQTGGIDISNMRRISYPYFCLQNTINGAWGIKLSTTKRENKCFFSSHGRLFWWKGTKQSKHSQHFMTSWRMWRKTWSLGHKRPTSFADTQFVVAGSLVVLCLWFGAEVDKKCSQVNWSGEGAFKVELLAIFDSEGREGAVRRGEGSVMGKFGEVSLVWLWLAQYIGGMGWGVLICYGISLLSTDGPSAWGGGWIKVSGKEGGGGKACLIPRKRRRKESSHNVDSQEKGIGLMLIQVPLLPLYVGEWNRYGGLGGLLRFPIIIPLLGCCTHTHCCSAIALALLASGRCPISEIDSPFNSSAAGLLHIFAETERFYC